MKTKSCVYLMGKTVYVISYWIDIENQNLCQAGIPVTPSVKIVIITSQQR